MNKIEKLHESIRALFRTEGEKFCYTPGEIERLVCSLNYKRLYSVLCDTAEPVYICCAGGGICDSHQYHSTKLFPANATLIWSDEGEPLGDDNISTSYSNELWLLEDMTFCAWTRRSLLLSAGKICPGPGCPQRITLPPAPSCSAAQRISAWAKSLLPSASCRFWPRS